MWGGTNITWLHKLEVSVKTLIKIILHKDKLFSTVQLYKEFGTLNINGLYFKNIFFQMLKMDISSYDIPHEYNTRSKKLTNVNSIKYKTVFGQKSVIFVGTAFFRKFNINLSHLKALNKKQ